MDGVSSTRITSYQQLPNQSAVSGGKGEKTSDVAISSFKEAVQNLPTGKKLDVEALRVVIDDIKSNPDNVDVKLNILFNKVFGNTSDKKLSESEKIKKQEKTFDLLFKAGLGELLKEQNFDAYKLSRKNIKILSHSYTITSEGGIHRQVRSDDKKNEKIIGEGGVKKVYKLIAKRGTESQVRAIVNKENEKQDLSSSIEAGKVFKDSEFLLTGTYQEYQSAKIGKTGKTGKKKRVFISKEMQTDLNKDSDNLSVKQKISALLQVAKGLKEMHDKDWVHLDVKPENVFVTHDKKNVEAKLADFDFANKKEFFFDKTGELRTKLKTIDENKAKEYRLEYYHDENGEIQERYVEEEDEPTEYIDIPKCCTAGYQGKESVTGSIKTMDDAKATDVYSLGATISAVIYSEIPSSSIFSKSDLEDFQKTIASKRDEMKIKDVNENRKLDELDKLVLAMLRPDIKISDDDEDSSSEESSGEESSVQEPPEIRITIDQVVSKLEELDKMK